MNTHNLPPVLSNGEFSDELEVLTPEQMANLAIELLDGFGAEFPELGEIPVELNTDKDGLPKDGFESGKSAKKVYTPGLSNRPLYDPTERTGANDPRQKDFATWFVQCFGKTVTMRARTSAELKEPADLQHAKVPKIIRSLLQTQNEDEKIDLTQQLSNVVAHNMGLEIDDERTVRVISAHIWMLNKISALIAPTEATV